MVKITKRIWMALIAITLAGCGGGGGDVGSPGAEISGRIADGYIRGAIVFWDCNNNMELDPDEPSTVSAAGGVYSLSSAPQPKPPLSACVLRAKVPASAIDEDSGKPVGSAFTMSAQPGKPEFISPITTVLEQGVFTEDEFKNKFPAAVGLSLSADYIAAGEAGKQIHNAAKYIAITLATVEGQITTANEASRKETLTKAVSFVPTSAYADPAATVATLQEFKFSGMPNSISATLDKAEFGLVESAFSGASDPRRAFVQQALDSIRKYPEAVVGSSVNWRQIPESERSLWSSSIVGGANGFVDSPGVTSAIEALRSAQATAMAEIEAERAKAVKKVGVVVAKNLSGIAITSADSLVKAFPVSSAASRATVFAKINKAKGISKDLVALLAVAPTLLSGVANCGSLVSDLAFFESANDFAELDKVADISFSITRCVAGLLGADEAANLIDIITAKRTMVESAFDIQLLGVLKGLSDLVGVSLDIAGLGPAAAVHNETLGMYITFLYAMNEQNTASKQAAEDLDAGLAVITKRLESIAENTAGILIAMRLAPYIAPKHPISVNIPTAAEVGAPFSIAIDQNVVQAIRYQVDFGDGSPAQEWTRSANSTSATIQHTYTSFGNYSVGVYLFDATYGTIPFPFQSLGRQISISGVSAIAPTAATLDVPVSFTVTGQNLPLTAVMSIADAECQTPTNRSSTGFSVICTPRGSAGSKTVTIKTDTLANGGTVLDATRTVAISSGAQLPIISAAFGSSHTLATGQSGGACSVNWGDGSIVPFSDCPATVDHIYSYPSVFRVSVTDSLATEHVFVASTATDGWIGYASSLGNYSKFHDAKADYIADGRMYFSPSLAATGYYWTNFTMIQDIDAIADNSIVEARIKNPQSEGGISCYDTVLSVIGDAGKAISVAFMSPGCTHYAYVVAADTAFSGGAWGETRDVSGLGQSFSDWATVKLTTSGSRLRIFHNDIEVYAVDYQGDIGRVKGVSAVFKGSGSVDWIKIKNGAGTEVYFNDFNTTQ